MTNMKFIAILVLVITSCKSRGDKPQATVTRANPADSNRIPQSRPSNQIDALKYKPLKFGFYKTSSGDIFELKRFNDEDSAGSYQVTELDSTLVVGEYSNRKPIKNYLDIDSYTEDSNSNFSKDKSFVYYVRAQSDGDVRFVVEAADPKTFRGIKDGWGKDKNHVFYNAEVVPSADVKSFQVYTHSSDSARDKNHIYYCGEMIK